MKSTSKAPGHPYDVARHGLERIVHDAHTEFDRWYQFMNTLGAMAVGMAVAAWGTPWPTPSAWLLFMSLVWLRVQGNGRFPATVAKLRAKPIKREADRILLKGLEWRFLGLRAVFTKCPVFLLGYLVLTSSCLWPLFMPGLTALGFVSR